MLSSSTDKLRVACTGAGYFSRFHYDAWRRINGVELTGALAQSLESASTTGCTPYTDLQTMLEKEKPDLLDIITPPPTHLDFISQALERGIKSIICQKPFCRSIEEANEAIELASRANAVIVVHENFRFQPWYRAIKEQLDKGTIGDLHQVTFRLRTGDGQGPEAYLDRQPYFQDMPRFLVHETAVHWIDTFRFLMGDPDWVFGDLRKMNPVIAGEDAGYILFGFKDGKRALFDGNRLLDHSAENHRMTLGECLVEGTTGTLELHGNGSVTARDFGSTESRVLLKSENWPGFPGDCVYALQKHVVDALFGRGSLENRAEDYLPVLMIEQAVYRSAASGQRLEL